MPAGLRLTAQTASFLSRVEAHLDNLAPALAAHPEFRRWWRARAILALSAGVAALDESRPLPPAVSHRPLAEALGGQVFEAVLIELIMVLEKDPDRSELLVRGASAAHRTVSGFKEPTSGAKRVGPDDYWDVPTGERLRLARDLHDWVGSTVSLALRQLDLHMIDCGRDDPAADRRLLEARRTLEEAMSSLGRLVSDLRERWTTSLEAALADYVARANVLCSATTVQILGDESQLPARVRDELFVVVREALRNAFVHAQAGQVDVTIDIAPSYVRARVEDNGVGLSSGRADSPGNGIASMRERIEMLGGSFVITGGQPSGTRIDIVIQLRGVPGNNDS
ncbi:MAG: sensor histidine kinase [Pseudonocardiaceae bacterium]